MSEEVLRQYLRKLGEGIKHGCLGMVKDIGEKLNRIISDIASLKKDLHELLAAGIADHQSRPKGTPHKVFVSKLKEETQYAQWIFDDRSLSRVLCCIFLDNVNKVITEEEGTPEKRATDAMRALIFALLPGKSRSTWREGITNMHSSFRRKIVMNAIFNA